jgi:hypothetical protein
MTESGREREAGPRAPFSRPEPVRSAPSAGAELASGHSRRIPQALVLVVLTAMALTSSLAHASWVNNGAGFGSSRAVLTGAGSSPTPTTSGRNVSLTWPTSTYSNGVAVPSYLVQRYNAAGTVVQTIGSGTCAALVTGLTCTESAVPAGSWRYSVTPAVGNWRGAESTKVAATVGAPSLSLTPVLTRATATLSGTAANFVTGQSLTFRLDNATSGTVLAGTLAGVATPTAVGATGGAAVTVTLPAGTTAGAHTIYAVTANGENAGQAITVDNTPPPTPTITSGPTGRVTATTATFTFTDTEPGVTFACSLDGSAATACTSGAAYPGLADSAHTFSVSAIDAAGNTSAVATRTWTVDTAGPTNNIVFPVDGTSYTAASFTAGCSTGGTNDLCGTTSDGAGLATVRVSLRDLSTGLYWNGGAFVGTEFLLTPTGTTTWTYNLPAVTVPDGSYAVRVYATDTLGNQSSASSTIGIDTVGPPQPTVSARPADPSTSQSATFAFTDAEAGVSFRCSLDGAAAVPCTSPHTYTGLSETTHTFVVRAADAAGNLSTPAPTETWEVDATAPTGTITAPLDGGSYTAGAYTALCGAQDLCGTASDAGTGIATKRVSVQNQAGSYWTGTAFSSATEIKLVTGGAGASWTYTLPAASLPDGTYTVRLYVTDLAGLVNAPISSTFAIDRVTPPVPTIDSGPTSPTSAAAATFAFSDSEPGVAFRCSLDGAAATACTSPIAYTGLSDGAHTFSVRAVDAAGNTSAAATSSWTVDATAPANTATFPVDGSSYPTATYDAGCATGGGDLCGTTADAGTGVSTVTVSVQRMSSGLYWDGTSFAAATESLRTPTGTTSWTLNLAGTSLPDGTYTVRTHATDAVGNVSTTTTTFTIDTVAPPAPSITAGPSGTTASSTASLTFSDTEAGVTFACSLDGAAASPCTSPTVYRALTNAAHTFSVTATDAAGNTSAPATRAWTVNAAAAGGAVTFPVAGGAYRTTTWNAGCTAGTGDICGTASAVGGVASVALSIEQVGTGLFWNGTAFASATEAFVTATNTTSWRYALTTAQQPDGDYAVRYFVTSTAGNVSQASATTTYTIDTVAPTSQATSTTNAGTANRMGTGDTLVFTTSETLLPSSVLAGWTGSTTSVVVRVTNQGGAGNNDSLAIYDTTNTTQLRLGTVDLGATGYVTATLTFGGTIAQSGSTIVLTLGNPSAPGQVGTATGNPDLVWTPLTGMTDAAGNALATTARTETDNDPDF